MTADLPPGWFWTTLGEIADWSSGGTPRRTEESYYGGDIPWAVIGDLNDEVVTQCKGSITHEGLSNSSCKIVRPGTILIAMYGSIGKLGIAGMPMATNQAIASAVPRISSQYLFYFLLAQRSQLAEAGKGATQRNISQTILKAWPIPVAPPVEQDRIVAVIEEHISRLDATETALLTAQQKADALLKAVVGQECRGSWATVPLAEIITSLRNGVFVSRPAAEPPGRPIYRISAVRPLRLRIEDIRYALPEPKRADEYAVNSGDVLFTRYSGNPSYVGAAAVVPDAGSGVLHPDKLIRVVVDRAQILPEWLAAYISVGEGRRQVEMRLKTTAGQVGISGSQLKSVPVAIPPVGYQRSAVARIVGVMADQQRIEQQLTTLRAKLSVLRRSILACAFAGQQLPQDLDDEMAEVIVG
ncbi:restriction endonuclease subunit S [Candidatus Poriferisodalis sp.]|uniref:restriction endonuclease subunit S n=1 Tax=Candidatus Poriferisodalis sp. TaxID=3101277 RepID=UPI003B018BA7